MSAGRILVVEDDPAVRRSTARALRLDRFEVLEADDGRRALDLLGSEGVDAILVDVMMPEVDGLELCRRLRSAGDHTPVLMVTARDTVNDRVDGLDAGADDYLVKPFALRELLARVRALLRRAASAPGAANQLSFADLVMDLSAYTVARGSRSIALTRTEFSLLALLLRHPRQVLTRSAIFEHIWGYDLGATSNSLGVYVGYLRRKTEAAGEARLIHTVRGVGYVLREG